MNNVYIILKIEFKIVIFVIIVEGEGEGCVCELETEEKINNVLDYLSRKWYFRDIN